jgi:hypothetical protein
MKAGPFAIDDENNSVIRVHTSMGNMTSIPPVGNMKQIGLAILNYAQANKAFPPAYTTDKSGKPLLSWRVLVLPFMGEENLYKQFNLDEPWYSKHNKQLIAKMPQAFKTPGSPASWSWKTNYLTVRGPHTIFPGKDKVRFGQISDGLSNTLMIVEVSEPKAVIWTKPDDFQYDQKEPLNGLIGLRRGGFNAGLGDSSVHFIKSTVDPETLKALFMRDDGKVIDWNALE